MKLKKYLPYAFFDLDGTLVTSMEGWKNVPVEFIKQFYPEMPKEDQEAIKWKRGNTVIIEYLKAHGITKTKEEAIAFGAEYMSKYYREHVQANKYAKDLLEDLKNHGVKMGIITATMHHEVEVCLEKVGLRSYFDTIFTPEDTICHIGKAKKEIFEVALKAVGCEDASNCMFFEDALYSIKTAHELGFYIIAVEDYWARDEKEEIQKLSNEYIQLN